jgi:hypothetical protein
MENHFIVEYKTYIGFDDCKGYNMTLGGESGYGQPVSEEIIQKQKQTNKEKYGFENYNNKEKTLLTMIKKYGSHSSQRTKTCIYCGMESTFSHQQLCPNNPNRKLPNKSGKNHHNAKEIKILNKKTKEILITKGNLRKFCKENGISYFKLWKGDEENFLRLN